jgi:hypothetical protein
MEATMLWRQGDIFIETAPAIPPGAIRQPHAVLAEGEATGHQHRIREVGSAVVFEHRGQTFLDVVADKANLIHEEHATIVLERGAYRFWRQREFDPMARTASEFDPMARTASSVGSFLHRFVMD